MRRMTSGDTKAHVILTQIPQTCAYDIVMLIAHSIHQIFFLFKGFFVIGKDEVTGSNSYHQLHLKHLCFGLLERK